MSTALTPYRARPLSLRERREAAVLRDAQLPAKRAAARVEAAAVVARVGLAYTGALTALEAQLLQQHGQLIDNRARAVVDAYVGMVATELAGLAIEDD
jgi:hypothetical protein